MGLDGGRTRDRTLDLSRVKGTLSLVSPSARPKNRRKTAAYAAYDFVVSYAIDPKILQVGPDWDQKKLRRSYLLVSLEALLTPDKQHGYTGVLPNGETADELAFWHHDH